MDVDSKLKSSVESLETIYAVVVGLAVTKAIEGILFGSSTIHANYDQLLKHLPEMTAFFFTIAPFFHGMHRHLNIAYLERSNQKAKQGFLLLDFFVFFLESFILLVFASSLSLGIAAFKPLIILLIIDSIWAVLAHFIHYHEWRNSPWKWAAINVATIIIMSLFLFSNIIDCETISLWALAALSIIRTVSDYIFCWDFYFPNETPEARN
ncbi:MAG: hypothetical protein ACYC9O_15565 [Candidatus Latescibacterota bacterium]